MTKTASAEQTESKKAEAAVGGQQVSPVHKKLLAIKADVGAIGKDRKGEGIRYTYRGIDDIYNGCHAAMIKHGVMHYPQVVPGTFVRSIQELQGKNGVRLQTQISYILDLHFVDVDSGSGVRITVPAEGFDDSDKAAGKAVSYGMKTALAHVLGIPTAAEEPDDERPDTSQDPDAVVTALVKAMTMAIDMEGVMAAYNKAPSFAKRHNDVIAAGEAARKRFA